MSLVSLVEEAFILALDLIPDSQHNNHARNGDSAVVFVHGYSRVFSGTYDFRRFHELACRRPLLLFDYDSNDCIEKIADEFRKFLRAHGDRNYFPVGHSLGGLIVRYFVEFLKDKELVRRAVLVATPNQGTLVAHAGWGESARQMIPGSDFLTRLNQAELSISYLNIFIQGDELVIPNEKAILSGAFNICIPDKRHLSVLSDQRLYRLINDFLRHRKLLLNNSTDSSL